MNKYIVGFIGCFIYALKLSIAAEGAHHDFNAEVGKVNISGHEVKLNFPPQDPLLDIIQRSHPVIRKSIEEEKALPWRIKVLLFTRAEIVEKGRDGIYRRRWNTIEPVQEEQILGALAQFKVLAEAKSNGRISVEFDFLKDDWPMTWFIEKPRPLFTEVFVGNKVFPHFNTSRFDVDDEIYRGPYNSVFYIHAALTEPSKTYMIQNTPVSGIALYTDPRASLKHSVLLNLYDKWIEHLNLTCRGKGYDIPIVQPISTIYNLEEPSQFMRDHMWSVVCSFDEPSSSEYDQRHWRSGPRGAFSWLDVRDDPWCKLPKLVIEFLPYKVYEDHVNLGRCVFVEACQIDDFWENLPTSAKCKISGYAVKDGKIYVAVSSSDCDFTEAFKSLEKSVTSGVDNRSVLALDPGFFSAEILTDSEHGRLIEVTETGAFRHGSVELLDPILLKEKFADNKGKLLSFWIKTKAVEPYALYVESKELGKKGWALLGSPILEPSEVQSSNHPFQILPVIPNDTWQKLTIDLDKIGLGLESISSIYLCPPPLAKFYERKDYGKVQVAFHGWSSGTLEDLINTSSPQNQLSESLETMTQLSKMREHLDKVQCKELLDILVHSKEPVQLNALAVCTRIKVPEAIPLLIQQARSATPMLAQMACRALAYQGSEECWDAMRDLVKSSLFDHNRHAAITQLGKRGEPKDAHIVSTSLTIRDWHGRYAATKALGKFNDRQSSFILLAFLHEIKPEVRSSVIRRLVPQYDLVNRRLLWNAVNDPSEAIRLASYLKLLQSPIAEYRSEGYKGVRDESVAIRLYLLDQMRQAPDENHRGALRIAVVDPNARVRAAALMAFTKLPNEVQIDEVENTFLDSDSRVQEALIELAELKKLCLPSSTINFLRESKNPMVAEKATRLSGA